MAIQIDTNLTGNDECFELRYCITGSKTFTAKTFEDNIIANTATNLNRVEICKESLYIPCLIAHFNTDLSDTDKTAVQTEFDNLTGVYNKNYFVRKKQLENAKLFTYKELGVVDNYDFWLTFKTERINFLKDSVSGLKNGINIIDDQDSNYKEYLSIDLRQKITTILETGLV